MRQWAAEMLVALEALHEQGVLCRDLNPRNLLLDQAGRSPGPRGRRVGPHPTPPLWREAPEPSRQRRKFPQSQADAEVICFFPCLPSPAFSGRTLLSLVGQG